MYKQIGSYKGQIQALSNTWLESNRGSKLFCEVKDLAPVWNMEPVVWYFYIYLYNRWNYEFNSHPRQVLLYPGLYDKFVSDLWQVSDQVSFTNKNFGHNITKTINTKIYILLPNLTSGFLIICKCELKLFTIS